MSLNIIFEISKTVFLFVSKYLRFGVIEYSKILLTCNGRIFRFRDFRYIN